MGKKMSILLEIKSNIKKYSIIVFVVILALLLVVTISSHQKQEERYKLNTHMWHQMMLQTIQGRVRDVGLNRIQDIPEQINSYKEAVMFQVYLSEQVLQYDLAEDYKLVNLNRARDYLFMWLLVTEHNENWHRFPEEERLIGPREYFGEKWEDVRSRIGFPSIGDFYYENLVGVSRIGGEATAYMALLYLDLHENGIMRLYPTSTSPWAFIYSLFRTNIPIFFGFFAIVIGTQVLSIQRDTGVIKNKLIASKNRVTFLMRSSFIGIFISTMICFLLLFSVFTVQGIKHGFNDGGHPILVQRDVLQKWEPNLELVETGSHRENVYNALFFNMINLRNPRQAFEDNIFFSLKKVVLIQLSLLLLYIIFWCLVGFCASVYFKNGALALGVAIVMFFASDILTTLATSTRGTMWDLTGLFALNDILSGFRPVTLYQILTVKFVGIVLLSIAIVLGFRRQDIK